MISGLVSVMILNWNGKRFLQECLEAVSQQTYLSFEIIFVDNGSTDGSGEFVRENFPAVTIVTLDQNYGFSGGNVRGLRYCRGEYLVLLNNDTCADSQWLEKLVKPMKGDSTIGICASQMLVYGTDMINSAGDGLTTAGVGYNRGLGKNRACYATEEAVFGTCAGAGLYRRTMLEEVGFLDEDFFLYDEDTDLNFRALLAGWTCQYVPNAFVYHTVNGTSGRLSDMHVYYHTRNLEFVWLKNMPTGLMWRFAHHKVIQAFGSFTYLCLRHGKWRPFFRAKRDALRLFPRMLKKRQDIQKKRKVSNRAIKVMLTPIFCKELIGQKIQQFIKG